MLIHTYRIYAACALLGIAGCIADTNLPVVNLQGLTMGTTYNVTLIAPPAEMSLQTMTGRIESTLMDIEKLASTYRDDSELSMFNRNASTGWVAISAKLCTLVSEALAVSQQTAGAFDITIGPLVNLWGFGPQDGINEPPAAAAIDAAMRHVGHDDIRTNCARPAIRKASADMYLDLSGTAKGYAVDRVAAVLDEVAVKNYLVEVGGELRVKGHNAQSRAFRIGIEDPESGVIDVNTLVLIANAAMATSGDYRNFLEHDGVRYSHTIDPRSGWPIRHDLAAVTVVSETTAFADAMATALLVLGRDAGMAYANRHNIAAYFVTRTADGFKYESSAAFAPLLNH